MTSDGEEHIQYANPDVFESTILLALTHVYPDAIEIYRIEEIKLWEKL